MQADPVATRGPQALAVVALLALATLSAPPAQAEDGRPFNVVSGYLDEPVLGARRVKHLHETPAPGPHQRGIIARLVDHQNIARRGAGHRPGPAASGTASRPDRHGRPARRFPRSRPA